MPSWGDILTEIQAENVRIEGLKQSNPSHPDANEIPGALVCKRYLKRLAKHHKPNRNVFLYASCWLQKSQIPSDLVTVHQSDLDGFLELVCHSNKSSRELDFIIHSPGGSPEAAEQIINYLRQKYDYIRVIVPHMAMSAATMMALAADEICMARHSTLGPTDPQFILRSNTRETRMVPAHALKEEFREAQSAAKANPATFSAWAPILSQYPPGIMAQCDHSLTLTRDLVRTWLRQYMLKNFKGDKARKAQSIAKYFSGEHHHSHGRPLMRKQLKEKSLNISSMEADNTEQDIIMSIYHSATHLLGGTIVTKMILSDAGKGYLRMFAPPTPKP